MTVMNEEETQDFWKCATEVDKNFEDWEIEELTGTIKCRYKRILGMSGSRIGVDKYLIDIIDKISKKYKFIYQYTSNVAFIFFELSKDIDYFKQSKPKEDK